MARDPCVQDLLLRAQYVLCLSALHINADSVAATPHIMHAGTASVCWRLTAAAECSEWLRENSFEHFAYHFARFNIPFYAMSFVNFFIINDGDVAQGDKRLLLALQELMDSPTYDAKCMFIAVSVHCCPRSIDSDLFHSRCILAP